MSEVRVTIRPVSLPDGPRGTMARLRGRGRYALLESALTMPRQAEWSYIAGPSLGGPGVGWPGSDGSGPQGWDETLQHAREAAPPRRPWRAGARALRTGRAAFEDGVQRIRERIADGEVLQVNLTRREEASFEG